MLKKSLISRTQPRRAETRFFPGSGLASLRPSTGTRLPHHSAGRTNVVLLARRTVRPGGYASDTRSQRPYLGEGASLGEEAVLADSGWVKYPPGLGG